MEVGGTKTRRLQRLNKIYLSTPRFPALTLKSTRASKPSPQRPVKQPGYLPSVRQLPRVNSTLSIGAAHEQLTHRESVCAEGPESSQMRATNSTLTQYKSEHVSSLPNLEPAKPSSEFPMSCLMAAEKFSSQLSDYEKMEILEFPMVFCLGLGAKKIEPTLSLPNAGFDDDRGDYYAVIGDHIAYRFEVLGTLGKGSFGQVLRCYDHKRKETVALKVLRNKKRFHQQGAIEIKVLETLRDRDPEDTMNIVRMKLCFRFRKHICMVFELLNINLYELLRANGYQGISMALTRRIAHQLLVSLKYTKELRIIHCDLKPENVLLRQSNRSSVKLIDFGSACFEDARIYTYIQSRFYRAPEVILGASYSFAIDMWSLACVLAELLSGRPLFHGENEHEQLQAIMEVLGLPPSKLLTICSRRLIFFEEDNEPKLQPNSKGRIKVPGRKSLEEAIGTNDELFCSFMRRCLDWDARKRLTPEEGLSHEWLLEK